MMSRFILIKDKKEVPMKHMTFALAVVMALSLGSTALLAAAEGSDEAQIKALEQRIADGAKAKTSTP